MREESENRAAGSVRPWKLPLTTTRLIVRPACGAPGSVISLLLMSAKRPARPAASEPEFRHMNFAYGQPSPPRLWPISARNALSKRYCDRLGVMMLAIACGLASAASTLPGVWPAPSMP